MKSICSDWSEKIVVRLRDDEQFIMKEIVNEKGDRYRYDAIQNVAKKCLVIFLLTPAVCFIRISINALQIGFDFAHVNFLATVQILKQLFHLKVIDAVKTYFETRALMTEYMIEDIAKIIRAPVFAIGIQLASLFGIFKPYEGRRLVAFLEEKSNYGASRNEDFRYVYKKQFEPQDTTCWNVFKSYVKFTYYALSKRDEPVVWYTARCFQSIGSLSDKNIIHHVDFPRLWNDLDR